MAAKQLLDTNSPFGSHRASWRDRQVWRMCDHPLLPTAWRRRLRKRFARPVNGPFDVEHHDMRLRLYPAENYCDRVIFGRGHLPEQAELGAILPLLKPGLVFVDIGANVGSYSLFVGTHLRGKCTLFALEPHPRTFSKLVTNLRFSALPVDHVFNVGIGGRSEKKDLWSDGGSNIGHTSMLKAGTANAKTSVEVDVRPLAKLLTESGVDRIDLLKIDIEGYEDRALAPFLKDAPASLLPEHILIEVAHSDLWEIDLLTMLQSLGYRERFSTAENRLLSRSD